MTVLLMDRFESSPRSERATVARPEGHRTISLSGNGKKIAAEPTFDTDTDAEFILLCIVRIFMKRSHNQDVSVCQFFN